MHRQDSRSNSSLGSYSQHSGSSNVESGSLVDEKKRLDSYFFYPPPHNVNILLLAKYGFIYPRSSPDSHSVCCVGCGKEVERWEVGDLPSEGRFHEEGCRFLIDQQGSEHSPTSEVPRLEESFIRASVQSNEESTKPLQTASTSGATAAPMEFSPHEAEKTSQSLVPTKESASRPHKRHMSLPPHRTTLEFTEVRRVEGKENTVTHLSQFRSITPQEFSHPQQRPSELQFSHSPSQSSAFSSLQTANILSQPGSIQRQRSQERDTYILHEPSASLQYGPTEGYRPENPSLPEELANLNLRNAEDRLHTFQRFWADDIEFRNVRLLVNCGFYSIGQGDAVECFCCHVIVANWSRNDNPKQRHIDMSPQCRLMRGEDCGDTQLPPEPRRRMPASPVPSLRHPSIQSHHSGHSGHSRHSNHSSPYQSLAHNPISHPSLEGASAAPESYIHPSATVIERSNLMIEFPCANPANPEMREERVRLQTLSNPEFRRNTRLRATNEVLAQAGMYYLGDGDRCKCWFCDGGLKDFLPEDNPWVEHAKFFPQCEYLLQQKGPAWVASISVQNPNIERPIFPQRQSHVLPNVVASPSPLPPPPVPIDRIEDPQQQLQIREQMLNEAMQSEPVVIARQMGFTDEQIKDAQMRKILQSNCYYQTSEMLVNALLNPNGEPDSPGPQEGNVIDLSGQTIHIRGGNFIGPSIINGRLQRLPPSDGMRGPRQTRRNIITINGRTMEEIMDEAFGNPFFDESTNYYDPSSHVTFNNNGATVSSGGFSSGSTTGGFSTLRPSPLVLPTPAARQPMPSPTPTESSNTSSTAPSSVTPSSSTISGSAEERLEEIERERRCKVCFTNVADILFQPCGHICACSSCSNRLNSCPVCRLRIIRYIRTYHA